MASDNVKEHFTEHENDDVDWEGAEAVLDDIQMDIRPSGHCCGCFHCNCGS